MRTYVHLTHGARTNKLGVRHERDQRERERERERDEFIPSTVGIVI